MIGENIFGCQKFQINNTHLAQFGYGKMATHKLVVNINQVKSVWMEICEYVSKVTYFKKVYNL